MSTRLRVNGRVPGTLAGGESSRRAPKRPLKIGRFDYWVSRNAELGPILDNSAAGSSDCPAVMPRLLIRLLPRTRLHPQKTALKSPRRVSACRNSAFDPSYRESRARLFRLPPPWYRP